MSEIAKFLSRVNAVLESSGLKPEANPEGITIASSHGVTSVTATPDADASAHGSDAITAAVTTSLDWPPRSLDLQQVALINCMAGLGALVKDEETGAFSISTRFRCRAEMSESVAAARTGFWSLQMRMG